VGLGIVGGFFMVSGGVWEIGGGWYRGRGSEGGVGEVGVVSAGSWVVWEMSDSGEWIK
jgi:hypothetical protein